MLYSTKELLKNLIYDICTGIGTVIIFWACIIYIIQYRKILMDKLNKFRRQKDVQICIDTKWESILSGDGQNIECYLCKKYAYHACYTCPVVIYSPKSMGCNNTPFIPYKDLYIYFIHHKIYELHAETSAAAQMEIDFLYKVKENIK